MSDDGVRFVRCRECMESGRDGRAERLVVMLVDGSLVVACEVHVASAVLVLELTVEQLAPIELACGLSAMAEPETFTCQQCGDTFEKAWSDADAAAEALELWGPDPQAMVLLCDDCFRGVVP